MNEQSLRPPEKVGAHYRVPWRRADPDLVVVHARYQELRGTYKQRSRDAEVKKARYVRAKEEFDEQAALEIVDECVRDHALDRLIDFLEHTELEPIIVIPHPEWDAGMGEIDARAGPTNALPFAFAQHLSRVLDCEIDDSILQIARPGRKKLRNFQRFIWQPKFEGEPRSDRAYIIADDVCHFGGTMAMLRSHIVERGGTVVGTTALACHDGNHQQFPIVDRKAAEIRTLYGEQVDTLWREEIGHDTKCLTEPEGDFLLWWGRSCQDDASAGAGEPLLQRLREEIAKARAS